MKLSKNKGVKFTILMFIVMLFFSSCLTAKKMDKFIAEQYNDQIPKIDKKKKAADITVLSTLPSSTNISTTVSHTKVLPLIVYWVIDYRHTITLNSQIAVANFSNTVNSLANKGLSQKLNGQKLELTVEQVPEIFALVEKTHVIWLIYAFQWSKIYIEPDVKDLVVSYKLYNDDNLAKTGRITIKNTEKNKGLRFFQSWKSAITEYLTDYNAEVLAMAKQFVNKLVEEQ